jgi:hypothetical protein
MIVLIVCYESGQLAKSVIQRLADFLRVVFLLGGPLRRICLGDPDVDSCFAVCRNEGRAIEPWVFGLVVAQLFEIRNKEWLTEKLLDVLRENRVALALSDTSFMPRPWEQKLDLITTDFVYVRWLGDRKGIEKQTITWDKTIVDKTEDLQHWAKLFREYRRRDLKTFAFANNHFSGNGPETVKLFWNLYK